MEGTDADPSSETKRVYHGFVTVSGISGGRAGRARTNCLSRNQLLPAFGRWPWPRRPTTSS